MSKPPYRALRIILGFLSLVLAVAGTLLVISNKPLVMRMFMHPPDMLTSALTGEIAMRRGRYAEAVTAFEQAVDAQDALNYDEPPNWLQPLRLYLGAALLKAGRAKTPKPSTAKNFTISMKTAGPCSACVKVYRLRAEPQRLGRFENDSSEPGKMRMSS